MVTLLAPIASQQGQIEGLILSCYVNRQFMNMIVKIPYSFSSEISKRVITPFHGVYIDFML